MIRREKLSEISLKLTADRDDFIAAFRKNIFTYLADREITINDIAEAADIPFSTLNTFLYGSSKDLRLTTAVKLARALNVSIDELAGADTMQLLTRESIAICRNLPESAVYMIRWYIRYINTLILPKSNKQKCIFVMQPETDKEGNLQVVERYDRLNISNFQEPLKSKIFCGIQLDNDNYMPYYSPYDILLIANDRRPRLSEHVIIRSKKYLYIAKQQMVNGRASYFSIRDGKYRLNDEDIDECIGYVVCKMDN